MSEYKESESCPECDSLYGEHIHGCPYSDPTWKPGRIELWLDSKIDQAYGNGHENLTELLGWIQRHIPKGW